MKQFVYCIEGEHNAEFFTPQTPPNKDKVFVEVEGSTLEAVIKALGVLIAPGNNVKIKITEGNHE